MYTFKKQIADHSGIESATGLESQKQNNYGETVRQPQKKYSFTNFPRPEENKFN